MCGFAGFCDKNERFYMNGRKIASDMADKIRHRGPDSEGVFSDSFFSVGFRRLKIIDLAGGEQPLYSADGRYVLCFNGEIYNYQTLRNELTEKFGVHFRTSSDTEVLLYCCIYYGGSFCVIIQLLLAYGRIKVRKATKSSAVGHGKMKITVFFKLFSVVEHKMTRHKPFYALEGGSFGWNVLELEVVR